MVKETGKYKRLKWVVLGLVFMLSNLNTLSGKTAEQDSLVRKDIVSFIRKGSYFVNHTEFDSAIVLFKKADSLSSITNSFSLKANSLYNLGVTYYRNGDYVKCGDYFDKALEVISKTNDSLSLAHYNLGIGILHKKKGDYKKASDYVFKAIDVLEQSNNIQLLASSYNTMAGIQNQLENDSIALKYYKNSLISYNEIIDSISIAKTLNNIGNFYLERFQYQNALNYLKQGFNLKIQLKDLNSISVSANSIGKLFLEINEFDSAYYYLNLAFKYALNSDNTINLVEICHLRTRYYIEQNKLDSALFYIDYAKPIIDKNNLKIRRLNNYELSSLVYEKSGNYSKALDYSRKYKKLNKEILSADLAQNINDLQFQYETEKKDLEITNLNEVNELKSKSLQLRNISLVVISVLLITAIILMILFYRAYIQRKKAHDQIQFLMREKQHRTKNNLQLLSSVLNMQSYYSKEVDKSKSLEVENRVQSIVLLDRLLYEANETGDEIDIEYYLSELLFGLVEAYDIDRKIEVNTQIVSQIIAAEQAKFIGLIVNEIITNSFKYAFPNHSHPQLNLIFKMHSGKKYQLIISDNGPGISGSSKSASSASLGMKVIKIMSEQLKGQYQIENRNGFYFELVFEIKKGLH